MLALYLDQNYLSGIAKHKPAFVELELAVAVTSCDLVTCDAFMADVVQRARLDRRHRCELFTGRQPDVVALHKRLAALCARAERR